MDWQIRLGLIIAGLILVGYIYFDYNKKKKIQKENDRLKRQFSGLDDQVDSAGFDRSGVGSVRIANAGSSINEYIDEQSNPSSSTNQSNQSSQPRTEPVINLNADVRQEPVIEKVDFETAIESSIESNLESLNHLSSQSDSEIKRQPPEKLTKSSVAEQKILTETKADVFAQKNESIKASPQKQSSNSKTVVQEQLVFSLIVQAPLDKAFKGQDFLPLFLSQGLRHGDMGIFHRHQKNKIVGKGPGPVLFSLANAIAPGTFSLTGLESFETPALALFMTLPGPDDPQVAYNAMLNTARLLQLELGGQLLDETKSQYTEQVHNHRLDQIQEFNRKGFML